MQININVTDLDAVDLDTIVGEEVAWYNPETEETEYRPRTLGDVLIDRLLIAMTSHKDSWRDSLQARVTKLRDETIRAAIEPMVQQVLDAGFQPATRYGEPVGEPTTLRELIMDEVGTYFKPKDRYNKSPFQTLLAAEVNAAFTKELRDAIAAEKEKAQALVREHAAKIMAQTIASLGK